LSSRSPRSETEAGGPAGSGARTSGDPGVDDIFDDDYVPALEGKLRLFSEPDLARGAGLGSIAGRPDKIDFRGILILRERSARKIKAPFKTPTRMISRPE